MIGTVTRILGLDNKLHKISIVYNDDGSADITDLSEFSPGQSLEEVQAEYRDKLYVVEMQLLAKDADSDREAHILDSLEEAIIDAFDNAVTLGLFSGFSIVEGPNWEAAGRTQLQDSSVAGIALGSLMLKIVEAKNYVG